MLGASSPPMTRHWPKVSAPSRSMARFDVPVVERARLLLQREAAIAAREATAARAES